VVLPLGFVAVMIGETHALRTADLATSRN